MVESVASPSALIGGPPEKPPVKKPRPMLPPGVKVVPAFPGATYGIHPVDKKGISLKDAVLLEVPGTTPSPAPTPVPRPIQQPQPAPEPQPQPQPAPEPAKPEPAPDFSDLPPNMNGNAQPGPQPGPQQQQQQQGEPSRDQVLSAYALMARMCFEMVIRLLCMVFGEFWQPKDADERKIVVDAIISYLDSIVAPILSPLQNLWLAIAGYSLPRLPATFQKIFAWIKSRKEKKKQGGGRDPKGPAIPVDAEVTQQPEKETPSAEAPGAEFFPG